MKEKGITQYELYTKYNINRAQVHRLKHNMNVQTNTLDRLCNILNCNIEDIIEHVPDDNLLLKLAVERKYYSTMFLT